MKRVLAAGLSGLMMSVCAPAMAAASGEGASPFTLKGSARIRYESLSDLFRAGSEGSDQMLSSRVRIHGE